MNPSPAAQFRWRRSRPSSHLPIEAPGNTLLDGRFRVIAANTGEAIDLGWLSDRIANIPSVQWLVTRVAVAVNWPSDWVVLSASDVEYRSYRRSFGPAVDDSSAVTKEDTSLIELSEPGQLLELTATILDVEDDRWICHLCKQYLNGPRLLAEHLDQRRHLTKLGMLQDAEIRAHRVVRLVQWARTAKVEHKQRAIHAVPETLEDMEENPEALPLEELEENPWADLEGPGYEGWRGE
jgi:hypothetical protein